MDEEDNAKQIEEQYISDADTPTLLDVRNQRPKTRYRFGVVETSYHQIHGSQPSGLVESRFSGWISSDEQPYGPRFMNRVGPDWVKLDCGWVKKASMLFLKNEPQDKTLIGEAAVQVGLWVGQDHVVPFAEIPAEFPSHSARFCPTDLDALYVRCLRGETRLTVTIYPA
jgi:hypothetical protein